MIRGKQTTVILVYSPISELESLRRQLEPLEVPVNIHRWLFIHSIHQDSGKAHDTVDSLLMKHHFGRIACDAVEAGCICRLLLW